MSILSDFEDRVGGTIEGLFAGAFRSPVQPSEIAKALARAMDDGRMVGIGKVYAPTSYTIALGPKDSANLKGFLPVLSGELAAYLKDHARERAYHLTCKPAISWLVHDDLKIGRFRVSAELAFAEDSPGGELHVPQEHQPASSGVYDFEAEEGLPEPELDTLTLADLGHDIVLRGDHLIIGRLVGCDICLEDANASRRHAELTFRDGVWSITDLGSTNGTLVNGTPVEHSPLKDGDIVEIGVTRMAYHSHRS